MKYEIAKGPPFRSLSMQVRRFLGRVPVIRLLVPAHWAFSRIQMREVVDKLFKSRQNENKSYFKELKKLSELCLKESPDFIVAWESRGYSCFELGLYQESAIYFRLITALRQDVESYVMLGDSSRDHSERLDSYRKAVEINPQNFAACDRLSSELAFQENYKDAMDVILSFLEHGNLNWYFLGNLAIYSLHLDDINAADRYLFQALEIDALEVMQWFEIDLPDACVGHEKLARKIHKYVNEIDEYAASNFFKFYARRQVAFDQNVEVWNAEESAVSSYLLTRKIPNVE